MELNTSAVRAVSPSFFPRQNPKIDELTNILHFYDVKLTMTGSAGLAGKSGADCTKRAPAAQWNTMQFE
ncbi:hypothetical protein O0544_19715 [Edwardsiella anguillarum]|nr:hypothetical protein [Edwardsiella anguillarum]